FGLFTDKRDLGVSPDDLANAKKPGRAPILGLRYTGDGKCPKARFKRLTDEFPGRFYRLDLEGDNHSTIAIDCCPDAVDEVVAFLGKYVAGRGDVVFPRHSKVDSEVEVVLGSCKGAVRCEPHGHG